jgi:copper transport protein
VRRGTGGRTAAALVVVAVALATARPAGAHAVLESTNPGDGARLDAAPAEVVFDFSEPVGATTGAVRVIDGEGNRVDDGRVDAADDLVSVGLQADLPDGGYVATYRVVSGDGHPISGAITFTVGDGPAVDGELLSSVFDRDGDRPWEVAGAVLRWLAYVGALFVGGAAFFLLAVDDDRRPGTLAAIRGAALVAAIGVFANLAVQAQLASGLGLWSLFRGGVAGDVLDDNVGLSAAAVALGVSVVGLAAAARPSPLRRILLLVGALAGTAGFALSGHTATSDPELLTTVADAVHAVAAATWFGGVVLVVAAVRRHRAGDDPVAAGRVVARFSALAAAAVVVVGAAGATVSWSEVRTLDALTSTSYGKLLVAKVAVVGVVGLLAAYNRLRLVPAVAATTVEKPKAAAWRQLRHVVRLEALGMVAVVAITAVLVQVTPARASYTGPFSTTVALGEGSVNVVVDPPRVGDTSLHLYLLDDGGRPADLAAEGITVELSLPAQELGPIEREPFVAGPGHYQVDGELFAVAGTWEVEVDARLSRFEAVSATVEVSIRR